MDKQKSHPAMGGFLFSPKTSLLSLLLCGRRLSDLLDRFKSRTVLGGLESLTISDAQGAMASI
jgi:hypothetical protein